MSLSQNVASSAVASKLESIIYRKDAETGLLDAEKAILLERLSNEKALLAAPSFIPLLEHALYVADNKYNREPTYKGITNCIYDCMR